MLKKILIVLILLLVAVVGLLSFGFQPEPFAQGSQSAARLAHGPHAIAAVDRSFVDKSRPTNALEDYPGAAQRTLTGRVWYPEDGVGQPYPLIVYSHGFSSSFEGGKYIAEHLASWGFVVVSVNYPLTHMQAPAGPDPKDVVNQPGDVSFLIDALLAANDEPGNPLQGKVDAERIGATGISLGGMTTTLAAYHPTLRDRRIDAALSIAGPTAFFTEQFYQFTQLPFLMLAGDIDALVPYGSNAAPVPERVPGAELVTIRNASHTGFADPAKHLRWMHNVDALGCWVVASKVNAATEEPWYELLGTAEQGIDYSAENELCLVDPLPEAMNVLRQQMITAVVVTSFFQRELSANASEREAAEQYLSTVMTQELTEVSYQR